ncbi:MAG: M23 family metallopeptidase [Clostridia bacterium]
MNIKFDEKIKKEFVPQNGKLPTGYVLLLVAMVLMSALSLTITFKAYSRNNKERYTQVASQDIKEKDTEDVSAGVVAEEQSNVQIEKAKEEKEEKEALPVIAKVKPVKVDEVLDFSAPVEGKIIKESSIDEVVYWETLDVWKVHEGVDIAAEKGSSVKSAEAGKVKAIKADPIFGRLVIIDHGQGYLSVYCNLEEMVSVKEGATVKKGEVIGKVGDTAYGETKEESHLHFEMLKNSVFIDPANIIKF